MKLPPPGDGTRFELEDEVSLRYFRLQQMTEGSIGLGSGEADPLKGPTDVGTHAVREESVELSSLVERLNERFGTDFTEADQLFFDQIQAPAQENERVVEAVKANTMQNFSAFFEQIMDELFIERMEGNEDIFARVMGDKAFRGAAHEHLAYEIFKRIRDQQTGN